MRNSGVIGPYSSSQPIDVSNRTEILRFSALSNESWSMVIRYGASLDQVRGMLDSYLRMDSLANNTYMLVVNRTLDLEEFPDFDVYLFINPVNEYAPEFIDGPYVFNISESQAAGSVLIDLLPHARDRDINLNTDEINGFAVVSYQRNPRNDGAVYFNMTDGHKGQIILGKVLDFEQLQAMNSTTLWLNVTVMDVSRKSSWTTIQVNVLDDDDLGPEFYHAGCPVLPLKELICTFGYHVSIPINFTGNVLSMSPAAIFAHDRDSLNYSIQFGLEDAPVGSGDALNVSSHLELDPVTAEMKVIEPFTETGKFSVNIVKYTVTNS
ncbi:hypothetical protein C0Q70_00190 [Pomacea canaliculata]|uniref:Cadherin domain-containing protein n=1 Tax=Pomacea canaliculata TaxID=400727 RepID=A0A2T7PVY6_POMCA|nr:hypothetical protein C0Q70_00190 [Pomacea canaliculata]